MNATTVACITIMEYMLQVSTKDRTEAKEEKPEREVGTNKETSRKST